MAHENENGEKTESRAVLDALEELVAEHDRTLECDDVSPESLSTPCHNDTPGMQMAREAIADSYGLEAPGYPEQTVGDRGAW